MEIISYKAILSIIIGAALEIVLTGCVSVMPHLPGEAAHQESINLIEIGTTYLRQGKIERAQAAFSASLKLSPSPSAIDGLGCVEFLRGNTVQAESLYRKAIAFDPNYGPAFSNLALIYELQGLTSDAQVLYEQAQALEPSNVRLRNNFALFEAGLGRKAEGRELLLEAAAIANNPIIESNVAEIGK